MSHHGGYGRNSGGHRSRDNGYGRQCTDVWTDGACPRNGQSGARGGIGVYWGDGDSRNVAEPAYGRQTNNSAEIQAATKAVHQAREQGIRDLRINTDSEFLVKSQTQWVDNWKSNDWHTSRNEPVKNQADFQALDRELQRGDVNVQWNHVRGHAGDYGNAQADRLANAGARMHHY